MKKTVNINLSGFPFIIDDDAFNMLNDYLDTIRYAFKTQDDAGEIASDIEARIAELLLEMDPERNRIITISDISKVIERIGKPQEIFGIEEIETEQSQDLENTKTEEIRVEEEVTPPPYESEPKFSKNPFSRKKLFRDPQNSLLGGVCSGLAAYLNIDVTIVRLLTVLVFFLSGTTVAIIYIILWIVVPAANTPFQKMQMMGKDPTVENIGKTVTGNYQDISVQSASDNQKGTFFGVLNNLFSIFVKCLIILGLIIAVPLLIALAAGLAGCVIAVFIIGLAIVGGFSAGVNGMFDTTLEAQMVFYILLAVIGGIITIGIPLLLFYRMLTKKKDKESSVQNRSVLLVVWLCGIAVLSVFTVKAVNTGKQISNDEMRVKVEKIKDGEIEDDQIGSIDIGSNGISVKDTTGMTIVSINEEGISINKKNEVEKEKTEVTVIRTDTISQPVDSIPPTH